MADTPHCHHDDHQPEQDGEHHEMHHSCSPRSRPDYLLWGSIAGVTFLYIQYLLWPESTAFANWYETLASSVFEFMNRMWWSLLLGLFMLTLLVRIPREFVMSALGRKKGIKSLLRATAAGVLLDLCSHGILMVAAQLYRKGASTGQVIAFLIASPWNSVSLTLLLIALIGFWWTVVITLLSVVVALMSGILFDMLVRKQILPENPHAFELAQDFRFVAEARGEWKKLKITPSFVAGMIRDGLLESRMVMRWIIFGVLLAGGIRALMPEAFFNTWFGPTLAGLGLTLVVATVLEVCSEGSVPIAADLFTRAAAPGNGFTFLMAGVSTDYTEIMVLKECTGSWKTALFLPIVTLPQILLLSVLLNSV